MRKFLILLSVLVLVVGCSFKRENASDKVEAYLNNYTGLSDNVLGEIDELIMNEEITEDEKDKYKEILKRQYSNLDYSVENESYDGDTCLVTVKITVFDLNKASNDAYLYLQEKPEQFLTNGEYDTLKYRNYKLDLMKSVEDTVTYNIVFRVIKINGEWEVEQPESEVLEKIHGVYKYEE